MTVSSCERRATTRARGRGVATFAAGLPPTVIVLTLYALSRLWSSLLLTAGLALAPRPPGIARDGVALDGFFDLTGSVWDAWYYRDIAQHGYSTELPHDADGAVTGNSWAFLPVFAVLARTAATLLASDYSVGAVVVATLAGGAASLVLFMLLEPSIGRTRSLWAVAAFAFGPMGFVLQVGYAESLFLFSFFAGALAMRRHRYWVMLPFMLLGAFTRPGMVALTLALALHGLLRLVRRDGIRVPDVVAIAVVGCTSAAAGLAWPVVVGAVTGDPDGYLQTEMAWWRQVVPGVDHFVPLSPWFLMGSKVAGPGGIVLVLAGVAIACWFLLGRGRRELGSDVLATVSSYALYLFAVFLPQQSTLRLLLPVSPLLGARMFTASRARRVLTVSSGALLQPVTITLLWVVSYP